MDLKLDFGKINDCPNLFNIVRKKQATVANVLNFTPLNVSFRRALVGNLNNNDLFSVKSMYKYLVNNEIKVTQEFWHMKVPLKIKIFIWFLKKGWY
jgi:hypothetical protein